MESSGKLEKSQGKVGEFCVKNLADTLTGQGSRGSQGKVREFCEKTGKSQGISVKLENLF